MAEKYLLCVFIVYTNATHTPIIRQYTQNIRNWYWYLFRIHLLIIYKNFQFFQIAQNYRDEITNCKSVRTYTTVINQLYARLNDIFSILLLRTPNANSYCVQFNGNAKVQLYQFFSSYITYIHMCSYQATYPHLPHDLYYVMCLSACKREKKNIEKLFISQHLWFGYISFCCCCPNDVLDAVLYQHMNCFIKYLM